MECPGQVPSEDSAAKEKQMRKSFRAVLLVLLLSGAALAQDSSLTRQQQAQRKLLAYRAARADAIRRLAERIRGLEISSQTQVEDFVTTNDQIATSLDAWLNGMKEVNKPIWDEEYTCEVTMSVKLAEVVEQLKTWHKKYYKGGKVRIEQIDEITHRVDVKELVETGMGAAPEALMVPEKVATENSTRVSLTSLNDQTKRFWMQHCTPRGRLMAMRAAEADALRRLAERVRGVQISSTTRVQDFVTESDQIALASQAFIRGARTTGVRFYDNELIVEVEKTIKLRTLLATVNTWAQTHYKGDRKKIRELEQRILSTKDNVIYEVGMGIPPQKYLKDSATQGDMLAMNTASQAPMWVSETLTATGMAAMDPERPAAQAKLMALRGAELDARRKLAERLSGLQITSSTSVQDFVAESDQIHTAMQTFQQGVYVVEGSDKVHDDGTVSVEAAVELRPLWQMIVHYRKTLSIPVK
jgi:hypothetical protein